MKTFPRNIERRALWTKNVSERCWGSDVKNCMPATNISARLKPLRGLHKFIIKKLIKYVSLKM